MAGLMLAVTAVRYIMRAPLQTTALGMRCPPIQARKSAARPTEDGAMRPSQTMPRLRVNDGAQTHGIRVPNGGRHRAPMRVPKSAEVANTERKLRLVKVL